MGFTKKANNEYKARIVARGFQQSEVIDDLYSPVAKTQTLKILLSYCVQNSLKINQMDVEAAFLNGEVISEVYVEQPEGYNDNSGRVCKLKKALYALSESPRAWYECLNEFLTRIGFKRSENDYCLYYIVDDNVPIFLLTFVDDFLLCGKDQNKLNKIKGFLFENERFR